MSVLKEIVDWNKDLPNWQSDAIRRLFMQQTLSTKDIDDLLALVKSEQGIADDQGRTPARLQASQIPAEPATATRIQLSAIKNLRHVNAIAEDCKLPIAPTGMTVIYGDNGSGKSGYARVLKRACRARDQAEPVLPNAAKPPTFGSKAQASFEVTINGATSDDIWSEGNPASDALSSISVFDGRCARTYLDNEDDFSYVPYGLDILRNLVVVCGQLKDRLDAELALSVFNPDDFKDLHGATTVGKLIESLSAKTNPEKIETLATLTIDETATRDKLSKALKEVDPKAKADQIRITASRISRIKDACIQTLPLIDLVAAQTLKQLDDESVRTRNAAKLAANAFKDDKTLLPGTGNEAWKALFKAARKFSAETYPDKPFPHVHDGSRCLLCQQPLGDAVARMTQFETFVQQEAEKSAQAAQVALGIAEKTFRSHNLSISLDDETQTELTALDKDLAESAKLFSQMIKQRHADILAALETHEWNKLCAIVDNPSDRLNTLATRLTEEASALDAASDPTARVAFQSTFDELDARRKLFVRKSAVVSAIVTLQRKTKLSNCISAVRTNAISLKVADLAQKAVSAELASVLTEEFAKLGVSDLRIKLESRVDKAKPKHKLVLSLPQIKNVAAVLSEGEQRAIAIASFLAEIRLTKANNGIVFDDPVSSLDHRRRELVAKRLAEESRERQVIVFTHDTYFLCVLLEAAEVARTSVFTQMLTKRPEGFGVPEDDFPIEGKSTSKRIAQLRTLHQRIVAVHKAGDDPEYKKLTAGAYRYMRDTWERATEEVLFAGAVVRFRKGIETRKLAGVVVEDSDYRAIDAGMTKCSNYSHDKAASGGVAVPLPDELISDIEAIESWRKDTVARSRDTKSAREAKP